jgi:hypothetical protein
MRKNKARKGEIWEERIKKSDEGGRSRTAEFNAKLGKVPGETCRGRQTGELSGKRGTERRVG